MSNSDTLSSLTVPSAISGQDGVDNAGGGAGFYNSGSIGPLSLLSSVSGGNGGSSGSLFGFFQAAGNGGAGVDNEGTLTRVYLAGQTSGGAGGNGENAGAGLNNSGTISTLINTGVIRGGTGGDAGYSITEAAYGTAGRNGVGLYNTGSLGTLINAGTILGRIDILNRGSIGLLSNSQQNLTVQGNTPAAYHTIFTTDGRYGSVVFQVGGTAAMSYGLAKSDGATYQVGTYSKVIQSNYALSLSPESQTDLTYQVALSGSCSAAAYCYDLTILSSEAPFTDAAKQVPDGFELASVLNKLSSNQSFSTMLNELSALPVATQIRALKQIAPSDLGTAIASAGNTLQPMSTATNQHMIAKLDNNGDGTGAAAGEAFSQGALWGQVLGSYSSRSTSSAGDGFASRSFGLLFGADTFIDDSVLFGGAVSWLRSSTNGIDNTSGNQTITDNYQISLYSGWRPDNGPAFIQGQTALGVNQYDQNRHIDFINEISSAKYNGLQMMGSLTAGYDIPVSNGLTMTPLGNVQISRIDNNSYQEHGSSLSQAIGSQGFNSLNSVLGLRLSQDFVTDLGKITAETQIGWDHAFWNSPIATAAVLGGVSYTTQSARLPADGTQVSAGITMKQTSDLSLQAEYDDNLRPGFASHTGLFRIRQTF